MRKVLMIVAAALLSVSIAQDYVFGIVFDAGGKFDGSFNEGTWRGLLRAIDGLDGYEIDLLEFEGTPDTSAQGHRQIAAEGAELIAAPGFAQADAVTNIANEYPDTNWVLIDGVSDAPNVRSVLFKEHEGSFLVGFIAGTMSQTGTVGFVGGMDIPLIRKFNLGYEEGVLAACPDCTVLNNYVGVTPAAWTDPARAKELATTQQAQGADIIYAAAGASGNGVIDFVNETQCYTPSGQLRSSPLADVLADIPVSSTYGAACGAGDQPLFFIGVDSNQNPFGDTDSDPTTLNHGLTSMLKRVDVAAEVAAMDVVDGTFTSGIVILGLAEAGVGFAVDDYNAALLPQRLLDDLAAISAQIVSGELAVTDYTTQ